VRYVCAAHVLARLRHPAWWRRNSAKRRPPHPLSVPDRRGVAPHRSRGRWVRRAPPPKKRSAAAGERPAWVVTLPSKRFTDRVWDIGFGTAGVRCGPPCSTGNNNNQSRPAGKESLPPAAARRGRPPWARRARVTRRESDGAQRVCRRRAWSRGQRRHDSGRRAHRRGRRAPRRGAHGALAAGRQCAGRPQATAAGEGPAARRRQTRRRAAARRDGAPPPDAAARARQTLRRAAPCSTGPRRSCHADDRERPLRRQAGVASVHGVRVRGRLGARRGTARARAATRRRPRGGAAAAEYCTGRAMATASVKERHEACYGTVQYVHVAPYDKILIFLEIGQTEIWPLEVFYNSKVSQKPPRTGPSSPILKVEEKYARMHVTISSWYSVILTWR